MTPVPGSRNNQSGPAPASSSTETTARSMRRRAISSLGRPASRWAALAERLAGLPRDEIARRRMDLAVVSVLLEAGAGPDWLFREPGTGVIYGRSEGLGVASLHMFASGA